MAPKLLLPNPENASLDDLAAVIRCSRSERDCRRFHAIKALILGFTREQVLRLYEIKETTLKSWIRRFNARGIDGLIEKKHTGRPRKIDAATAAHCHAILRRPEKVGVTHWTGVKLHGYLRDTLQIEVGYSTVIRFLQEQKFRLKIPRPWPDRQDEQARKAFCQHLATLVEDPQVELWFGDESGFEGDPRPRRRWAQKGEKIRVTKNGDHIRMNATGMICPRTGEAFFLEFSHSDTAVFQAFLREATQAVSSQRPRQILIVDNASWHKSKSLDWGRFEPLFLPAYSPDLNPIEALWLIIKQEWFADFVAKDRQRLIDRLDQALQWAMNDATRNRQTCAIRQIN